LSSGVLPNVIFRSSCLTTEKRRRKAFFFFSFFVFAEEAQKKEKGGGGGAHCACRPPCSYPLVLPTPTKKTPKKKKKGKGKKGGSGKLGLWRFSDSSGQTLSSARKRVNGGGRERKEKEEGRNACDQRSSAHLFRPAAR